MPTWADWAVFGFLIDRVGQYQLDEFANCSYLPLARQLPPYDTQILEEEEGPCSVWTVEGRGVCRTEQGRELVQAAVNKWYIIGLDMFGKSDSWRDERYIEWGLKRRTNSEARPQYIAEVNAANRKTRIGAPGFFRRPQILLVIRVIRVIRGHLTSSRSHLLNLGTAICAEGIAGPHGGFALRAGRVKVVAAVRAVVGARVDAAPTLRALRRMGFLSKKYSMKPIAFGTRITTKVHNVRFMPRRPASRLT